MLKIAFAEAIVGSHCTAPRRRSVQFSKDKQCNTFRVITQASLPKAYFCLKDSKSRLLGSWLLSSPVSHFLAFAWFPEVQRWAGGQESNQKPPSR